MNRLTRIVSVLALLPMVGCVSKSTYEEVVRSADQAQAALARRNAADNEDLVRLRRKLADLELGRASMQKELDEAGDVDAHLAREVDKLGGDSSALRAANGQLNVALAASHRRLDELRRAQTAADERAAIYRHLALKLKNMIDAGDLAITLREGQMVLRLSNDVLFDSGHAELKATGRRALTELARALQGIPDRRFQVAGHTDNEPIRVSAFTSNWDLSAARALEVVRFLVSSGVKPTGLSAAGYGEFDPVETNETHDGRARNRRTEITLQPNIDEMVVVPGAD